MSKSGRKERQEKYEEVVKLHPFHTDDYKIFIYNDKKEKDNYDIIRDIEGIRRVLKRLATNSDEFITEEMEDLRFFIKSQVGKKNFKKLCKIFTHK